MSEFEHNLGFKFVESRWEQRIFKRGIHAMVGITIGVSGVNYFLAPDERVTYTVVPLAGSVALLGLVKVYDRFHESTQDQILENIVNEFSETLEED